MAGNHKGGGIKHLLLAHCEKAVVLALVGVSAYLAYASLGVERLEKSEGELSQLVTSTSSAYDQSDWQDVPEENKLLAYPVASGKLDDLPPEPYTPEQGLSRAVVPPTVDRVDPKLLAATDVEGSAITGIFAFESEEVRRARELERRRKEEEQRKQREAERQAGADGGGRNGLLGGGDPRAGQQDVDDQGRKRRPAPGRVARDGLPTQGDELFVMKSVACVLAKAPIQDQLKLFEEAFEEARDYSPSRDIPEYLGLYAERAEVRGDSEELQWERVTFSSPTGGRRRPVLADAYLNEMIRDWIPWPTLLVDSRYAHPVLTMPLPPLAQQAWGPEVVHSDAPLQVETDAQAAAIDPNEEAPTEEAPEEQDIFNRRAPAGGARGEFDGGRGGAGRRMPRRGGGGFDGGYGGGRAGGRGGFDGGEFDGGGRGGRGGGGGRMGAVGAFQIDPDVPFAMIRIWDFDVTPGKQYRYRVKLILQDVNRDAAKSALAPEVIARLEASSGPLKTEWSKPSSVISVPMAGDVFVVKVNPPSGRSGSLGSADLLVQAYSLDENRRAVKAGVEKSFNRGAVINFTEDAEVVAPDGRWIVEFDSFEFHTGLTLVDFTGGDEIGSRMTAPGKALLMDSAGKLFVHDEIDDRDDVQTHRDTFDEDAAAQGGGFRGGGFDGGRGGGRDFGGFE